MEFGKCAFSSIECELCDRQFDKKEPEHQYKFLKEKPISLIILVYVALNLKF